MNPDELSDAQAVADPRFPFRIMLLLSFFYKPQGWPYTTRGFAWLLEGFYIWLGYRLPRALTERAYMRVIHEADPDHVKLPDVWVNGAFEVLDEWRRNRG
jgi:hypothetical protein